jgi:isopenicillin N synthase-like dioxygenase
MEPVMDTLDLPVVDFSDFHGPNRATFVAELGSALERYGFVAVSSHGIDVEVLREAYATARAFFALPAEVKRQYEDAATGRQRGYTGFGVEHAKDSKVGDLKEFFQVGRQLPEDHPLVLSGGMPRTPWPSEVSEFERVFSGLFARFDAFANDLLEAICEHLGLEHDSLGRAVAGGNSVNRIIHYPPVDGDAPRGAVRAAAHEDINLLTVLPASTEPGLELLDPSSNTWRAVYAPPNVMVCDTGDIMQRLTSRRLPATTHRVVNPPGSANVARLSMPFFVHPRPDWVIESVDGDAPPITAGAFLRERLVANGML